MQRLLVILLLFASTAFADSRTWTDASGHHHTNGELVDFQGGVAYLKKDNGKIVAVPLHSLSFADKKFVESSGPLVALIVGRVIEINGGDAIVVLEGSKAKRIRLASIEAPDLRQAYGTKSKKALSEKLLQRNVRILWRETDRHGRTLGQVFLDGRWINKEMVYDGWAWHYRKYSKSEVLAEAENDARAARRGLWADSNPVAPWEFQPESLDPITATECGIASKFVASPSDFVFSETVYVNQDGTKYHSAGCRLLQNGGIPMPLDDAAKRYSPCSECHHLAAERAPADEPAHYVPPPNPFADVLPYYPPIGSTGGPVYVHGYYRKNGTYVNPYTRSAPHHRR